MAQHQDGYDPVAHRSDHYLRPGMCFFGRSVFFLILGAPGAR